MTFTFSAGADANLQDEVGQTPLHKAVLCGEENVVEALLIHGADPDITDSVRHGHTALAWFFDNPLNARCLYALELLLQVSGGSRISPRLGRQLSGRGGGAPTYDFAKFSRKMHGIQRIWTSGGWDVPRVPLRSATAGGQCYKQSYETLFYNTVCDFTNCVGGSIYE